MTDVHQLIYVSVFNAGRVHGTLECLRDIVTISRKNNAPAGVTGYLVFDGSGFLQILEGERDRVDRTYAKIQSDPRHRETRIVGRLTAPEPAFRNWSMGGYLRRPDEALIFARHGVPGPITQVTFSADQALSLVKALAAAQPEQVLA